MTATATNSLPSELESSESLGLLSELEEEDFTMTAADTTSLSSELSKSSDPLSLALSSLFLFFNFVTYFFLMLLKGDTDNFVACFFAEEDNLVLEEAF
eukprot:12979274-Ditylum_brightwellii.AAC.1